MGLLTWVECHGRVLANVLFPNWLVTGLLLGLLIFLTYKTAKKALSLHRLRGQVPGTARGAEVSVIQEQKGPGVGIQKRVLERPE